MHFKITTINGKVYASNYQTNLFLNVTRYILLILTSVKKNKSLKTIQVI